uniref:Uncharacterized protein n=1 Tax=Rhizophagus irregularis (strain DAOM 181602 / DAOM 197198 / MUCL 43194) TaxID=747089 RepID=U9U438_RHIID
MGVHFGVKGIIDSLCIEIENEINEIINNKGLLVAEKNVDSDPHTYSFWNDEVTRDQGENDNNYYHHQQHLRGMKNVKTYDFESKSDPLAMFELKLKAASLYLSSVNEKLDEQICLVIAFRTLRNIKSQMLESEQDPG